MTHNVLTNTFLPRNIQIRISFIAANLLHTTMFLHNFQFPHQIDEFDMIVGLFD